MATKNSQSHFAMNTVTGGISNGATWVETITLVDEDGAALTGVAADEWRLTLRADEDQDTADLTLTNAVGGELTVTEGTTTTLDINCPQSSLDALDGDYVIDIVAKDSVTDKLTHYAHGLISVRNDPIAW